MITLIRTDNSNPGFGALIRQLDTELLGNYKEEQAIYSTYNKVENIDTVVVAYDDNEAAGCGCFKKFDETSVEIKRMYVAPGKRNLGIASAVLKELETWAAELNFSHAVLETGTKQFEAIRLYQKKGYVITENYGQYINMPNSICMKKKLGL